MNAGHAASWPVAGQESGHTLIIERRKVIKSRTTSDVFIYEHRATYYRRRDATRTVSTYAFDIRTH